jgi:hypothetical protein
MLNKQTKCRGSRCASSAATRLMWKYFSQTAMYRWSCWGPRFGTWDGMVSLTMRKVYTVSTYKELGQGVQPSCFKEGNQQTILGTKWLQRLQRGPSVSLKCHGMRNTTDRVEV